MTKLSPCIEIQQITKKFGGLMALMDVSTQVNANEIKSIIGPNGAGKTTLFNVITGFISASSGSIIYKGISLDRKKPHQIASLGIARTFQTPRIFGNMSALENIMVGRHIRTRSEILKAALSWPSSRKEETEIRARAEKIVHFIRLDAKRDELAKDLTFAEQRSLEIGRCLACDPGVVLMDEPAAGLDDKEQKELADLIFKIRDGGVTILLVEHHMRLVMKVSDKVLVLNYGAKIAEGTPAQIRSDERVINAYLGRKSSNA
jgi:branched-chain amino acid transport system ATP-binding protein